MANTATFLTKDLYQYLLDVSVRNNEHIEIGNEITDKEVGIPMQSSLEQLNFYTWLVTTLKLHNILEIGTYTGLSALAMAKGLSEGHIVCLDHSKQFLVNAFSNILLISFLQLTGNHLLTLQTSRIFLHSF